MRQRAGEHVLAVAAVLIAVCVAGIGALHFTDDPKPEACSCS